jgi:stage III sporulation protein AB
LSDLINLLEQMAVQIRYQALPLGELFAYFKGNVFIDTVIEQADEQNWRNAWGKAVNNFPELDSGDKEILKAIGNSLGNSDTMGQTAMLELNKNLLTARLSEASENVVRKGAMYRSVGLLTGLGLAIIIV